MKTVALATFLLATAHAANSTEPDAAKFLAAASETPKLESTAAAMEAALTDLMLGKTQFGATPMGGSVKKIEELITKDMMPKVLTAHRTDQNNLIRLANEIKKCGGTRDGNLRKAQPAKRDYNRYSTLHKKCRGKQAVLLASKNACMNQR